ncbi:MAG: inositol phosphorylceramide synthase [Chloroflexi bacterium]|nr:inositol phosphorylceramide synthase [Chloroflexota bacterium]
MLRALMRRHPALSEAVFVGVGLLAYFLSRGRIDRRRPDVYRLTRDAFLGSAVIGLICYRVFPVAPPRLAEDHDFVDTMQEYSKVSYQAQSLGPFVNPYAAVPSLHFGWSFLMSVALLLARPRTWWTWLLAIVQPALMFLAIVATANHWVLDAVAGLVVCGAGLIGAAALRAGGRRGRDEGHG